MSPLDEQNTQLGQSALHRTLRFLFTPKGSQLRRRAPGLLLGLVRSPSAPPTCRLAAAPEIPTVAPKTHRQVVHAIEARAPTRTFLAGFSSPVDSAAANACPYASATRGTWGLGTRLPGNERSAGLPRESRFRPAATPAAKSSLGDGFSGEGAFGVDAVDDEACPMW